MNYAGLPRILFNGDHPYSRKNDYTDIERAVIAASIRISHDTVIDDLCLSPTNIRKTRPQTKSGMNGFRAIIPD
jgi:hypothetical protein